MFEAGGIFMPLEPDYPEKRLDYLLVTVKPEVVIATASSFEVLMSKVGRMDYAQYLKYVLIIQEDLSLELAEVSAGELKGQTTKLASDYGPVPVEVTGEDSNYLLYTSGSTGFPKIIEGRHVSLSHFIHWEVSTFSLNKKSHVSQLVPISFDVSLRDIFVPLLCGGTLCIPDKSIKLKPKELIDWLGEQSLSLIHTVPSLFRLLTKELEENEELQDSLESLTHVLLSGEALYGRDVTGFRNVMGTGIELVNLYGPTETTLAKLFYQVGEIEDKNEIVALGNPITNTAVIILNGNKLCEIGEIGEICIKTPFRSKGYYKDETTTKEKFIQNPLHDEYEDIIYKTGDLGKYKEDRSIAFVGRQDSQLKIRGNRVELSEVERALMDYQGLEQVLVLPKKQQDDYVLICYYIGGSEIDPAAIRSFLSTQLPDYMFPSYYLRMEEFPLNLNGKIDKQSLPNPEELLYDRIAYEAPATKEEEPLCEIWSEILSLNKVGVNKSFFEIGGHSLSAAKVVTRVYERMGAEISL
ncbi:MAG: non-ribosomal peptide synthetase, partial [Bacteroidota bacterium]